jgi:hypothetical protein
VGPRITSSGVAARPALLNGAAVTSANAATMPLTAAEMDASSAWLSWNVQRLPISLREMPTRTNKRKSK